MYIHMTNNAKTKKTMQNTHATEKVLTVEDTYFDTHQRM